MVFLHVDSYDADQTFVQGKMFSFRKQSYFMIFLKIDSNIRTSISIIYPQAWFVD